MIAALAWGEGRLCTIPAVVHAVVRTVAFIFCGTALAVLHLEHIANWNMAMQLALYLGGALAFLRNKGVAVFHDHHLLHYFTTAASLLQVKNLLDRHSQKLGP